MAIDSGHVARPRSSGARLVGLVAAGVGLAVLGVATSAAGALISRMAWRPGVTVPYGLLLGCAASAGLMFLARHVSRPHALAALLGWLVGIGFALGGTSGGSFVIADDALGWSYLIAATVVTIGTALWGARRP